MRVSPLHPPKIVAACLLAVLTCACASVDRTDGAADVRLVVVVSVDQFRGDLAERYLERMGDRGFARMMREGATFSQCYYQHANNITGPGHAVLATGCDPARNGVVANEFFDDELQRELYCAADTAGVLGPFALNVPTVGDVLRKAHPEAKVVSIALKDRAAILMAGRDPTSVAWYDADSAAFITSARMQRPAWLDDYKNIQLRDELTKPSSSEALFTMALDVMHREELGMDDVPDLFFIGASTLDYAGHAFGPDSKEVADVMIQTDRDLARLIDALDARVGRKHYRLVVTGDHGAGPVPEELTTNVRPRVPLIDAGRLAPARLKQIADSVLTAHYGTPPTTWLRKVYFPGFFFDTDALERVGASVDEASRRVADALQQVHGVQVAHTRTDVTRDQRPPQVDSLEWSLIKAAFHPHRSGHVMIYPQRYWLFTLATASHQTFHDYDRWVGLLVLGGEPLAQKDQRAELVNSRIELPVNPRDIAPTIAAWLGLDMDDIDGRVIDVLR